MIAIFRPLPLGRSVRVLVRFVGLVSPELGSAMYCKRKELKIAAAFWRWPKGARVCRFAALLGHVHLMSAPPQSSGQPEHSSTRARPPPSELESSRLAGWQARPLGWLAGKLEDSASWLAAEPELANTNCLKGGDSGGEAKEAKERAKRQQTVPKGAR